MAVREELRKELVARCLFEDKRFGAPVLREHPEIRRGFCAQDGIHNEPAVTRPVEWELVFRRLQQDGLAVSAPDRFHEQVVDDGTMEATGAKCEPGAIGRPQGIGVACRIRHEPSRDAASDVNEPQIEVVVGAAAHHDDATVWR